MEIAKVYNITSCTVHNSEMLYLNYSSFITLVYSVYKANEQLHFYVNIVYISVL